MTLASLSGGIASIVKGTFLTTTVSRLTSEIVMRVDTQSLCVNAIPHTMPIRPENKDRYPNDWKEIVEKVRARSGNCCEGSPAYPDCRVGNGAAHPVTGSKVVLTTGHLDHTPEHCDLTNLRHWCQRCHLTYDSKHHAETRYMTNRCKGTEEMFDTTVARQQEQK